MQRLAMVIGPAVALVVMALMDVSGAERPAILTAGIACWTVLWWIFEPIPIPATSLIPLALLPVFGILTPAQVGAAYGSPLILLMLGGFILSMAMERSGAHRRIALALVNAVGGHSSRRLVFGFMLASCILSMWISNTATTLMLLPVAIAVLQSTPRKEIAAPLLLGLAYAASLGGIGTPIGTPPNLVFMQVYTETTGSSIGFTQWMGWAVPLLVLFLPLMALWLTRHLSGLSGVSLPQVGAWQTEERRVLAVFVVTALAWMTRKEPFGGWSNLLGVPGANDASVAMLAVVVMFLVPNGKGGRLLDWETAVKIPWGILLLFAGGICLAKGFGESGLSEQIGALLMGGLQLPIFITLLILALGVSFLTETTSNTASTILLMPILGAAALAAGIEPALLMVPAAMSASCAFMLPVATAPNSIVFSSGYMTIRRMAREGFVLNLIGGCLIAGLCYLFLA